MTSSILSVRRGGSKHTVGWLVAAGMAATTSACVGPGGGDDTSTLERIQTEGVVRVGYANEAPYAFVESSSDSLIGEAPAVARIVMNRLGVERVEGVLAEFGALIPGLQAGRFDLIAAGMYVRPERCEAVAFSEPTYCIGEAFLVSVQNPLALHSYDAVADHPTATLGVVAGTVELGYARALGVPDDRIVIFPDAPTALSGVQSGIVDAYAGTRLTVLDLIERADDRGIEIADPFQQPVIDGTPVRGCGAFAIRQQDAALLAAVNSELAEILGTEEHQRAVEPFGFGPPELPDGVTTARLCTVP